MAGDTASDWLGVLSCADKVVRDGLLELSALIMFGVLRNESSGAPSHPRGLLSYKSQL